jgi:hypothetical protein
MSESTHEYDCLIELPVARSSTVADFLRCHLLIHAYDGDVDRFLATLLRDPDADPGDVRFVRCLRTRLRREPAVLQTIRDMVSRASPFVPL